MNVYRRITNKVEGKCSEYIHTYIYIYIGHDVVQYGCLESENDETT